MISEVL